MDFEKKNTQELIDIYNEIESFLSFLEKEENNE